MVKRSNGGGGPLVSKAAKPKPTVLWRYTVQSGPISEHLCKDCGCYGCLIPVPHKQEAQS